MATKGNTPRLRLLVIVPLVAITLVCIQAEAQASSRALHFHQNDIQIKRFLREPPTTEDGTSDDRGIDITKLKDVTETGTSKLSSTVKELVESVKLKFMPDKQQ
ncbi:RxLR effector protein, partial [Phytophthora megakarya]